MSTLYIVATPIGNLADMTYRAVEVLQSVDFVVAEDTRHSRILFEKYDISTPLLSFHAQSSDRKAEEIIERIKKGESAAYISDAGTPCISDPGFKLTNLAARKLGNSVTIIPIPGASAVTSLVSASGFPSDKFTFLGFLPHKKGRQTILKSLNEIDHSVLFYESVHRFEKLLKELDEFVGGDRYICVGRELTKMHEEIFRGTVAQAQDHFTPENTKGEFVVMVAPSNFRLLGSYVS